MLMIHDFLKTVLCRVCSQMGDERGATAIEYGLIMLGIAIAIIVTVGLIGTNLDTIFVQVNTDMQ